MIHGGQKKKKSHTWGGGGGENTSSTSLFLKTQTDTLKTEDKNLPFQHTDNK